MDCEAPRYHITEPQRYHVPFLLLADSCATSQVKLSPRLENSALQMSGVGPHAATADKRAEFLFVIILASQPQKIIPVEWFSFHVASPQLFGLADGLNPSCDVLSDFYPDGKPLLLGNLQKQKWGRFLFSTSFVLLNVQKGHAWGKDLLQNLCWAGGKKKRDGNHRLNKIEVE